MEAEVLSSVSIQLQGALPPRQPIQGAGQAGAHPMPNSKGKGMNLLRLAARTFHCLRQVSASWPLDVQRSWNSGDDTTWT